MSTIPLEVRGVSKQFGALRALDDISFKVESGKVACLLGDNGAGKSTLIKILSGVHTPDGGELLIDGKPTTLRSPRAALDHGIATVYQDLALVPIMPVARNFFLGREPTKGRGPFRRYDVKRAERVTSAELDRIGVHIPDTRQPVQVLSGGQRQCVAIARAAYFGAKVLILDEPTSALGVKEAAIVLRYIVQARRDGLGIVFITHNVHHAYPVGDTFTVLNRGESYGTFAKDEISREEVLRLMAGGAELAELHDELERSADERDGALRDVEQELYDELQHMGEGGSQA